MATLTLSGFDQTALRSFIEDQGGVLTESEAILFILDDWFIAHGYREHYTDRSEHEE